jgi:hypothetical protein
MWNAGNFAVGDWFKCEYNGKQRPLCEVVEIPYGRDYITVKTEDGYRNFKFYGIQKLETIKLAD